MLNVADVIKLVDLYENAHIEKELMLIKLRALGRTTGGIETDFDIFHGKIVDTTESSYTIELTGSGVQLDDFISAAGSRHVLELARSGPLGLLKEQKY